MFPIDIQLNDVRIREMMNEAEKERKNRAIIDTFKQLKRKMRDNNDNE